MIDLSGIYLTCHINLVYGGHSQQAVIVHACHGHTPVISWHICLEQ